MDFSFTVCSFQLGEPPVTSVPGLPACNPHGEPPLFGDCWYNCTMEDISGDDKKHRLRKVLFCCLCNIFPFNLPKHLCIVENSIKYIKKII